MSATQVIGTSRMILIEYPELKIDDLALCFAKAKKGAYGKVYDRLDGPIVFEWIDKFLADKHEQVEYFWKFQQIEIKEGNKTLLIGPQTPAASNETAVKHIRAIKKDIAEMQKRNRQARDISLAKPVKENLIGQIHELFMQQFKDLYESEIWEDPKKARGTRFVTCCGKRLDIGEYIQKKHVQLINYYRKVNYYFGIHDPNYPRYIAPPMPDFSNMEEPEGNNSIEYYQLFNP